VAKVEKTIIIRKIAGAEMERLFNMAIDMLSVLGYDGYFKRLNPAFKKILGFSNEELMSKPFLEFIHPEDRATTLAIREKSQATGTPAYGVENRYICKDGSYRWISWDAKSVPTEGVVYSVGRDVTELKNAQEQLRIAKERLEDRVKERTLELVKANKLLRREIQQRKEALKALKLSEKKLETKTANLQEVNTALKVLLKKREEDKKEIEERIFSNINELIIPYLEKLNESGLDDRQKAYSAILKTNLDEITSSFSTSISMEWLKLTPAEIQVSNLVHQGKTTKEIANLLDLSPRTIETHRAHIRKKIGISHKKANLKSYFLQLKTT
jgi:PAS domain S-box-containing protein